MHNSLQRLKAKGFNPKTAVDVGAFEGEWSRTLHKVYPETKPLLIEALPEKADLLNKLASSIGGAVEKSYSPINLEKP